MAAGGVDLGAQGWEFTSLGGVSADGTLVFGQGMHLGNPEGYVLTFPGDFLKTFAPAPAPPPDSSIVGVWRAGDTARDGAVVVLNADGTYLTMQEASAAALAGAGAHGLERGTYEWDPVSGAFRFVTQQDTNGGLGFGESNGRRDLRVRVTGNTLTATVPGEPDTVLSRVVPVAGTLTGAWRVDEPADSRVLFAAVFLPDGVYYLGVAGDPAAEPSADTPPTGIEHGTYAWNPTTGTFTAHPTVDTNGDFGFSSNTPSARIEITSAGVLRFTDSGTVLTAQRVTDVRLALSLVGGGIEVTWPAYLTGYALQVSADGLAGGWQAQGGTPVLAGERFKVNLAAPAGQRYFRLAKP